MAKSPRSATPLAVRSAAEICCGKRSIWALAAPQISAEERTHGAVADLEKLVILPLLRIWEKNEI